MTEPASSVFSASWPGLALLHADAECVVVSKPSGIHSVPGLGSDKHDSLLTRLQAVDPLFHAVHRLDRDTSGVMVFGRTKAAVRALGMQFEARTVHKRYVALVAGLVADDAGEINLPMRYAPEIKPRQVVDAVNGKPAAVIASQALITGTFSLTLSAIQMGYLPRTTIRHTTENARGPITMSWPTLAFTVRLRRPGQSTRRSSARRARTGSNQRERSASTGLTVMAGPMTTGHVAHTCQQVFPEGSVLIADGGNTARPSLTANRCGCRSSSSGSCQTSRAPETPSGTSSTNRPTPSHRCTSSQKRRRRPRTDWVKGSSETAMAQPPNANGSYNQVQPGCLDPRRRRD
mgnify:CR=1 FL=1